VPTNQFRSAGAATQVMTVIRSESGFLSNFSTDVKQDLADDKYYINFFNPASNTAQQSILRLTNSSDSATYVKINAIDDLGQAAPEGEVGFYLQAHSGIMLTAQDLENGNNNKFSGQIGDGYGKWHLTISSSGELNVMNLIRTSDGMLTNLSNNVVLNKLETNWIDFFNPGSNTKQLSLLRFVNDSAQDVDIEIKAFDDSGEEAPGGSLILTSKANQAVNLRSYELENGASAKGLQGSLGTGKGKWHLQVTALNDGVRMMKFMRSTGGFLTNLSGSMLATTTPVEVGFFNPASNPNQLSLLRLVNRTNTSTTITISGIDDYGVQSSGNITLTLAANAAATLQSNDLEKGNTAKGLLNKLGDGYGKWRLQISSTNSVSVMSIIRTSDGMLSNLTSSINN